MHPVIPYLIAAILFGLGVYGVLVRRNAILLLAAVELMLNAVNIVLITADSTLNPTLPHAGSVFALFTIVLAAAEIGVGLAIVLQLYRLRGMIDVDSVPLGSIPLRRPPGDDATTTDSLRSPSAPGSPDEPTRSVGGEQP